MSILSQLTDTQRATVIQDLSAEATPRPSFYVLVLLSTAIASYGLLQNSTAVVIGAMLIAPLMGPIYGIALGLIRNDQGLLLRSGFTEAVGIVLAVGLALAIGMLPLRPDFGTEILARTKPNLLDLLVAVISGIAGGYARTNDRVSPTLPGVAIATALVPPLAVCGLCLSDARWDAALGAFLLFTTNLLAIEVAAGLVFVLTGLADKPARDRRTVAMLVRRFAVPVVLLVPIAVFLFQTLVVLVRDDRLSRELERVLNQNLRSVLGADVTEVRHEWKGSDLDVVAVVLTPQSIDPALVSTTEAELRRLVDPRAHLIVRSLISRDADRTGQVFLDEKLRQQLRSEREQQSFLVTLSAGLRKGLEDVRGAELIDVQRAERDSYRIKATVRAPVNMGPSQVEVMQQAAATATGAPIQLTVRSVLTRESDGHAYLDEDAETVVSRQVHDALTHILQQAAAGAELLSVQVQLGEPTAVTATVASPRAIGRQAADRLNRELSEAVGRSTRLTIRSVRLTSIAAGVAVLPPTPPAAPNK